MPQLPLIEPNTALFLDFDGTLADLAPRPELVQVEPELVGTLHTLFERLNGALAVISGRPISELDHFLQPLRLPAAGVHGAEFRTDGGMVSKTSAPGLEPLIPHLEALVRAYPALRLERKSVAVAIHYRQRLNWPAWSMPRSPKCCAMPSDWKRCPARWWSRSSRPASTRATPLPHS